MRRNTYEKILLFSAAVLTLGISVAGTTSVASAATNSDSKETVSFNVQNVTNNEQLANSIFSMKNALPHTAAPGGVPGGWSRVPGHSDTGWKVWHRW